MSAPTAPAPSDLRGMDVALRHTQRLATLGTLTGMIAHEFNNLLTPVMCYAQMALDAPADLALTRKALQKAAAGSERAAQIAEAILELARECQLPRAVSETCSVAAAVKSAIACIAREPAKDGIALTIDVREAGDAAMRPVSLQQVILNLVLNARKALLRGGDTEASRGGRGGAMELRVRAKRCNGPISLPPGAVACGAPEEGATALCHRDVQAWIEIVVEDTGCGIHTTLLPHVFDAWVTERTPGASAHARAGTGDAQAPDGGNEDGLVAKGTGLGLAMCAELVRAAGGWMWVKSEVGEGTRVGVVIRCAP